MDSPPVMTPPPLSRARLGWFLLLATVISFVIIGAAAMITHQPWVFPSLGPSAYLLFATPLAVTACPRNVFFGHLIASLAGVAGLLAFGMYGVAPNLHDVTWQRVGAVVVSVALTASVMTWLGVPHAPAAATTLTVSLGLLSTPLDLTVMLAAVVLLIAVAWAINRVRGVSVPLYPH